MSTDFAGERDGTPAEDEGKFLRGGGLVSDLIIHKDWSTTVLGPIATWPSNLKTVLATILRARHPMLLWWGPELIQFYNDAFVPSLGIGKHPAALGLPGRESWAEVWPIVGAQIDGVMDRGESAWSEDALVPILRNGRIEEVHWTYGYSPVVDESGRVAGTLIVCNETTSRVIAERRLTAVRAFVEKTLTCTDISAVIGAAFEVIHASATDIPFAVAYRVREGALPSQEAATELAPAYVTLLGALVAKQLAAGDVATPTVVELGESAVFPGGPWPAPSSRALLVRLTDDQGLYLLFGLSPRLPFDNTYRAFLVHLVEQIDLALSRARAIKSQGGMELERRNLLLQAPTPTALMIGPEHVFELANPLYERMVGRQVVGKTYLQAFPELRGTALPGILDTVYETGRPFVAPESLVRLDRDGDGKLEDCFFRFNLEPLRGGDGTIYGMMAIAFDITEQVMARRRLEEVIAAAQQSKDQATRAEEMVRSLVDNLPDLAWSARPDGYIDFYNHRWYEYTGTTLEQMQGWGWTSVHDPLMLDLVVKQWEVSLATGKQFEMEFPIRGADGTFRWFLTRVKPLRDGTGKIARWFGVNTDVNERKALLRQLEAANRSKDEFLATVSHELRTPLNAILGWSQLLLDNSDPLRLEKGLAVIERNAKAQAQLIEDLLDVSRIMSGKLRMNLKSVDLAMVAQAAVETAQPSAAARGVTLTVNIEPKLGHIAADEDRLQQVIWNLLSNAVKFTPQGGLVELRLQRVDSRIVITVRDTGVGISPGFLPHVFDRFRQDDSSTTRKHTGLGLGLAIVRNLVELHGGWVAAHSEGEGKGSTFRIELPIPADQPESSGIPESELSQQLSTRARRLRRLDGIRVLVVDDHEDARELVAMVLEDSGATVLHADSVATALKLLSNSPVSILVTDIGMPEEDGYGLITRLRSAGAAAAMRSLPAIAVTTYARVEDRDRALASGFQEHLAKPIDPKELVEVVAALVGR